MTDKQELAEDRTDWAEDRTILANERTFAGWMRTGMACVGVAIGLQAVFGELSPVYAARGIATLFAILALIIFFAAWRQSKRTIDRLNSHAAEPVSPTAMGIIAAIMSVGAAGVGIILWLV